MVKIECMAIFKGVILVDTKEVRRLVALDRINNKSAVGWLRIKLEQAVDKIDELQARVNNLELLAASLDNRCRELETRQTPHKYNAKGES